MSNRIRSRRTNLRRTALALVVAACGARDALSTDSSSESSLPDASPEGSAAGATLGIPDAADAATADAAADSDVPSGGSAGGAANGCLPLPAFHPHLPLRMVVLGDYGHVNEAARQTAALVRTLAPDVIATTGDNNYPSGARETIDANIGQYFSDFICPYQGRFGAGAMENRFFPALGNHDWYTAGAKPYLEYFDLPGNERYYDVDLGSIHLFAVDSDPAEPDGVTRDSAQAKWLEGALARSTAPWRLVTMHHPPFSSGSHGSSAHMQWPYGEWGADLVLAGHDHLYERLEVDGLPYIVTGLGGAGIYGFREPLAESIARYNAVHGVTLIEATSTMLAARFITVDGTVIDQLIISKP